MYVGVDIGRGYTKIISKDNSIKFPSYVSESRKLDLDIKTNDDLKNLRVTINEEEWFVGKLAKKEGGTREFQKEKSKHRNTIPLMITAIALTSNDEYISPKIVTGIPINDLPLGLSKSYKTFYKRISREKDILPSQAESLLIRKGEKELESLAQEIKDQLNMWWNGIALDVVFIAGGGGKVLIDYLEFGNMKLIKNAQMANAEGFHKIAQMKL